MKNAITYIFLLCSLSAFGQDVTKDSTAIELISGKYYSVKYTEYDNGNDSRVRTIIGDGTASAVFSQTLNTFRQQSATMANDAVFVSGFTKALTEIKRQNADVKTLIGMSPLDSIQAAEIATYLLPGWTLKTDGVATPTDIVFSVLANGQMRHNLGTAPRNVTFYGSQIRLHNFPSANKNTDLHKAQNGNFVSVDRNYILRRPGNNQQAAQQRKVKKQ